MSWLILGCLEEAPAPEGFGATEALVDYGYLMPVLYQFFNQAAGGEMVSKPELVLQRFAEEGRSILLSWWRSLSRPGREIILGAVRRSPDSLTRIDEMRDSEVRYRLMGTGLLSPTSTTTVVSQAVWRLLAEMGPGFQSEAEEPETLAIRARRAVEEFEATLRAVVEDCEQSLGKAGFEELLRRHLKSHQVESAMVRFKRSTRRYPLSDAIESEPLCHFLSLRELVTIATREVAWKRNDFGEILRRDALHLATVRDDFAHPRQIPEKELMRAIVLADDLGTMMRQDRQQG
jgi:hypothetical protein